MRVAGLTFTHFNLLAQQIRADEKMAKTLGQRIPSKSEDERFYIPYGFGKVPATVEKHFLKCTTIRPRLLHQ
ncbi:hypothetical protein Y032_0075g956 [Ancylostoma ceylanicum]|uniref:Uncharacterized protein n=1 Tax=Ancylostoma ceylanicum TaxID=53326 RepID=A0A016TU91_9BILA|nr:hypothetical protein Y032_0075g956 [Ancylostoma ceylanicum]